MFNQILKIMDKPMPNDEIQRKMESFEVVQEINKKIAAIFISIILALLALFVFYVAGKQVKSPNVVFVDEKNQVQTIKGGLLPIQSKAAVKKWTANAVRSIYTFDFLNYQDQLQNSKQLFTSDGWEAFKQAFNASDLRQQMLDKNLEIAVSLKEEPYFLGGESGIAIDKKTGNEFAWKLVVPVTITFTGNGEKTFYDEKLLNLLVLRVPTTESPNGLAIVQLLVSDYQNSSLK